MQSRVLAVILLILFVSSQFILAQESTTEKASVDSTIELKSIEPFFYCALEMTGSYEQHSSAFQTLYEAAGTQNVSLYEAPFSLFWNDPDQTPETELKWELGMEISEKKELQAPLTLKTWEFALVVSKIYEGPFEGEELQQSYQAIFEWLGKTEYTAVGPFAQKYLNMATQNAEGQWVGQLEILIPVQKKL